MFSVLKAHRIINFIKNYLPSRRLTQLLSTTKHFGVLQVNRFGGPLNRALHYDEDVKRMAHLVRFE